MQALKIENKMKLTLIIESYRNLIKVVTVVPQNFQERKM